MSVHQKKDGRWYVNHRDKESGKVKTQYFGRGLEAERAARDRNAELSPRTYTKRTPEPNSVYFSDLANSYMRARLAKMQSSSLDNLMWKLNGVIFPEIGHNRAMQLTHHRIDLYVAKRLKTGIKRTTIHRELSDIRAILNWGARRQYIAFNPIANYEMPKRDDDRIQPATRQEIAAIVANSPDRLIRAVIISYYTGVRPGSRELYSRSWDHVDFDEQTIFIESARKGGRIKSRTIHLHHDLLGLFQQWYNADKKLEVFPKRIINYRGKSVKSLKKSWKTAKTNAGISRRLRLYDIRHAFASLILKRHGDLKSVSEMLGHSRTETTTRIYQHTDSQMHRDAINELPSIVDLQNVGQKKALETL